MHSLTYTHTCRRHLAKCVHQHNMYVFVVCVVEIGRPPLTRACVVRTLQIAPIIINGTRAYRRSLATNMSTLEQIEKRRRCAGSGKFRIALRYSPSCFTSDWNRGVRRTTLNIVHIMCAHRREHVRRFATTTLCARCTSENAHIGPLYI